MHGNEITITMSRRHLLLVVGARTPHEDHLMVGYPGHEQLNQSDDIMTVSQHSGTGGWSRWSSIHLGRPSSSTLDLPFMGFSPLLRLVVIIAHPHDGRDHGLQTSDIRSSHPLRREVTAQTASSKMAFFTAPPLPPAQAALLLHLPAEWGLAWFPPPVGPCSQHDPFLSLCWTARRTRRPRLPSHPCSGLLWA